MVSNTASIDIQASCILLVVNLKLRRQLICPKTYTDGVSEVRILNGPSLRIIVRMVPICGSLCFYVVRWSDVSSSCLFHPALSSGWLICLTKGKHLGAQGASAGQWMFISPVPLCQSLPVCSVALPVSLYVTLCWLIFLHYHLLPVGKVGSPLLIPAFGKQKWGPQKKLAS